MKPGEKADKPIIELMKYILPTFAEFLCPNPLSLAATNGVSVDFPSFSYSDVSVR